MMQTRVQGIPCQVEMTGGYYQKPDYSTLDSDVDYYGGWFDVDFEIYDRRGNRAMWLEKKMTAKDEKRIIDELIENAGEDDGNI